MNVSLSRCANYFEELDNLLSDVMDGAVSLGENLHVSWHHVVIISVQATNYKWT